MGQSNKGDEQANSQPSENMAPAPKALPFLVSLQLPLAFIAQSERNINLEEQLRQFSRLLLNLRRTQA